MTEQLSGGELVQLVRRVFTPGPADQGLAIMADLPDAALPDSPEWRERRDLASAWARTLDERRDELGLRRVSLAWYRHAASNNADLPPTFHFGTPGATPASADALAGSPAVPFAELFAAHSLVVALTELSATAPLKVAARGGGFRAATMPGFLPGMIPALRLDYGEINRRVGLLKGLLDAADGARIVFRAGAGRHELRLDLRHRTAHASGGLLPANGVAGNLPSGEAYIVPYEGELPGDPSRSAGELPVQFGDELVVYRIEGNRAVAVLSSGPRSDEERELIRREPAYANLAELGLGVLAEFGVEPVGSILLDEKLGLHIAFGRSDHFGGQVGPADFSTPSAVVHVDRVYLPRMQPRIEVESLDLTSGGRDRRIMADGSYRGVF
jgi:hypothetical protein